MFHGLQLDTFAHSRLGPTFHNRTLSEKCDYDQNGKVRTWPLAWTDPVRISRAACSVRVLEAIETNGFVQINGYGLYYESVSASEGSQITLLTLHGGPGFTHHPLISLASQQRESLRYGSSFSASLAGVLQTGRRALADIRSAKQLKMLNQSERNLDPA